MSENRFESMKEKTVRTLYEAMWNGNPFLDRVKIEKVRVAATDPQGKLGVKISENSYWFAVDEKDKARGLIQVFGIKEPVLFRKKFLMACGGSGQEYRRINTLHSSSLCALLFFYRVTEDHPLKLTINGVEHCFTDSVFEFQSPVYGNPSNMDVVLIEKDKETGKATLLFLESKFSEYYTAASKTLPGVSNKYREAETYSGSFYEELFSKDDLQDDGDKYFKIVQQTKYYIGGIKQMISHYVGIRNLLDRHFVPDEIYRDDMSEDKKINIRKKRYIESLIREGADIILAEILFTDRIAGLEIEKGKACLDAYKPMYHKFAEKAKAEIKAAGLEKRFTVADSEFSYDMFAEDHSVEPEIREFYFNRRD